MFLPSPSRTSALLALALTSTLLNSPGALAIDHKACHGVGACVQLSDCEYYVDDPAMVAYKCGKTGPHFNGQQAAKAKLKLADNGLSLAKRVPDAEWPKHCDLDQPTKGSVKLKVHSGGATWYGFIDYTCEEKEKITDCYTHNLNPSTAHICKVVKEGTHCKPQGDISSPSVCKNTMNSRFFMWF